MRRFFFSEVRTSAEKIRINFERPPLGRTFVMLIYLIAVTLARAGVLSQLGARFKLS